MVQGVPRPAEAGPLNQARRQALALIDPPGATSAQYNLAPHLAHRTYIYEFPNPFEAPNWGFPGDQHQPAEIERLRYVVVERPLLGEADGALFEKLRGQPQWRTLLDRQGVVVLERRPVRLTAAVAARRFPYECEIARIARNHL